MFLLTVHFASDSFVCLKSLLILFCASLSLFVWSCLLAFPNTTVSLGCHFVHLKSCCGRENRSFYPFPFQIILSKTEAKALSKKIAAAVTRTRPSELRLSAVTATGMLVESNTNYFRKHTMLVAHTKKRGSERTHLIGCSHVCYYRTCTFDLWHKGRLITIVPSYLFDFRLHQLHIGEFLRPERKRDTNGLALFDCHVMVLTVSVPPHCRAVNNRSIGRMIKLVIFWSTRLSTNQNRHFPKPIRLMDLD